MKKSIIIIIFIFIIGISGIALINSKIFDNNNCSNNNIFNTVSSTSNTKCMRGDKNCNRDEIKYVNIAIPIGEEVSLFKKPSNNSEILKTKITGISKIEILKALKKEDFYYINVKGVNGYISTKVLLTLANNYQDNVGRRNSVDVTYKNNKEVTISVPGGVQVYYFESADLETREGTLINTSRGTITLGILKNMGSSTKVMYRDKEVYISSDILTKYCVDRITAENL